MVCLIGIDRFIRVKYLNNYERVFTATKYSLTLFLCMLVSTIQTSITLIGPLYFGEGYGALLSLPINVIVGCVTTVCYLFSIKKLKDNNKRSRAISSSDRSLVKMASLHVIILFCCYLPVIAYGMLYKTLKLNKSALGIFTAVLFILSSVHGIINAIVFIFKNTQNKDALRVLLRGPTNNVHPAKDNS